MITMLRKNLHHDRQELLAARDNLFRKDAAAHGFEEHGRIALRSISACNVPTSQAAGELSYLLTRPWELADVDAVIDLIDRTLQSTSAKGLAR